MLFFKEILGGRSKKTEYNYDAYREVLIALGKKNELDDLIRTIRSTTNLDTKSQLGVTLNNLITDLFPDADEDTKATFVRAYAEFPTEPSALESSVVLEMSTPPVEVEVEEVVVDNDNEIIARAIAAGKVEPVVSIPQQFVVTPDVLHHPFANKANHLVLPEGLAKPPTWNGPQKILPPVEPPKTIGSK